MDNIVKHLPIPPFQVRTSGCIRENPYHSTPGTKEGDIMLTVFLSGKGVFTQARRHTEIRAGMVGLVRESDRGVLYSDYHDPYYHYYCRFGGEYAFFMAEELLAEHGNFFYHDHIELIADMIRSMGHFHRQFMPEKMGRRELILVQILMFLSGSEWEEVNPKLTRHSIINYLNEHITETTDLDRMASYFLVSKSTLCRAAHSQLGMTIQKMHEKIKIDWAKTLLKSGSFNVKEVAGRVGFYDPMYFSRVFRKNTGKPPGKWREQI